MSEIKIKVEGEEAKFNLKELLQELIAQADIIYLEDIIAQFAWQDAIQDKVMDILAREFSRSSWNPDIHKKRQAFLRAISQKEIEYHSVELARAMEEKWRYGKNYWTLYHAFRERYNCEPYLGTPNPYPVIKDSPFDENVVAEMEKLIASFFTAKHQECQPGQEATAEIKKEAL